MVHVAASKQGGEMAGFESVPGSKITRAGSLIPYSGVEFEMSLENDALAVPFALEVKYGRGGRRNAPDRGAVGYQRL